MRHYLFAALALAGCKWTTFDDLADTAWAQSSQTPNVGSTDYAVAIVGTTVDPSGGRLSVLSNDTPSYSTLVYDAKGKSTLGPNPERLGAHFIGSLGEQPIFVGDGAGRFAIVAESTTAGTLAVHSGLADAPGDTTFTSPVPPDAAVFAGTTLAIAAGDNLFLAGTDGVRWCSSMFTQLGALAYQPPSSSYPNGLLWSWDSGAGSEDGPISAWDLGDLETRCPLIPQAMPPPAAPAKIVGFQTPGFRPAVGSRLLVVGDHVLVAAGHADKSTTSAVYVVDTTATPLPLSSPALSPTDLESAIASPLGSSGDWYVALGFPNAMQAGKTTGDVELHSVDPATGAIDASTAETLYDEQPDSNEQFGRGLAVMQFNGTNVLVVAASSEVFAYFRTTLYGETRQQ